MQMLIHGFTKVFSSMQSLSLLLMRLILAYGFFEPAMNKIKNFPSIVTWFKNSLHLPFPELHAYLATGTEALGVVLLALGLATRFISVPLMVVMVVAATMVHGLDTFSAAKNGYEINLYYFSMLFILVTTGPGKISLDETVMKSLFGKK